MKLKENTLLDKEISEKVLLTLPKDQFHNLYLEIESIIDKYKDKYEQNFLLGEFIRKKYDTLLNDRFKQLKKKYGELNYEILNKDKVVKDLKNMQKDSASIEESLRLIGETCNLTAYTFTLEALPLIVNTKYKRQVKKERKKELYAVFDEIYAEIISSLHISGYKTLKQDCFTLLLEIYERLRRNTKFRGPQNLSPIIIYMFFNMKGHNLDIKDIINIINISDKDMRQGLKEVINVYPEYLKKDKKMLVLNRVKQIRAKFNLPIEFITNSEAIMEKFWPYIHNTTENVIAGTVCVLTIIAMDITEYYYTEICKSIGIAPSAVIYQIRTNLFRRLHISGFQSVAKSREMIRELILKNVNIKLPESKD